MNCAALLLAAGAGSRFQGPSHKLRAMVRGRPVFSWALDAVVEAGFACTAVVTRDDLLDDLVPESVAVLRNPRWAEGMATSLQVGLAWAAIQGAEAVVVGLADQPFLGPEPWRRVAAARQPLAVATYGGKRRNPVRLAAEVWPLLPKTGDEGARSVLAQHPTLVGEIPCPGNPGDIDTLEDLRTWN